MIDLSENCLVQYAVPAEASLQGNQCDGMTPKWGNSPIKVMNIDCISNNPGSTTDPPFNQYDNLPPCACLRLRVSAAKILRLVEV